MATERTLVYRGQQMSCTQEAVDNAKENGIDLLTEMESAVDRMLEIVDAENKNS